MPGMVSKRPTVVRRNEDSWEYYVRWFIQSYNLDDSQQQSAQSLLRESKEQAARYREAHKQEFNDLEAADKANANAPIQKDPDGPL